jgi:hypothetical protein
MGHLADKIVDVRCDVDEDYWCMQWCAEVLPEPAMIPDLRVFLRSAPASAQAVTSRGKRQRKQEPRTAEVTHREKPFPARLKLPFLLSATGEKTLTTD